MVNDLTNYMAPLIAMGIRSLRNRVVLPRLVNRAYDGAPGEKFSTVRIPIPSAIVATDVVPGHVAPDTGPIAPTFVQMVVDQWKEAAFTLTDEDLLKVSHGIIPMQADEALKALAEAIDDHIWSRAKGFSTVVGTPGVTPFATDLTVYTDARKVLNRRNVPKADRFAIIDADAEANAINLRAFQDASWRGDVAGIVEGEIGRKLGAMWIQSNSVPLHTSTPFSAGAVTVNGVNAKGATAISVNKATNPTNLKEGDSIVIAHAEGPRAYAVAEAVTLIVGNTTVQLVSGLEFQTVGGEAITQTASFVRNVLLHRDAIAFVTRPLAESNPANAGPRQLAAFETIVDADSGLTLRLELTREFKQWRWSYDILWGSGLVRPDFGVIMAG